MEEKLQTFCDQLAAAQKAKDDHIDAMAEVEAQLVRARHSYKELGTKLNAASAATLPTSSAAPSSVLSLLVAATQSETGEISDDLRASLQAVIGKLEAEASARGLAKAEAAEAASAAAAAAVAAAVPTTPTATIASNTATASEAPATTTATTAATAPSETHRRPPPALQALCTWPDGCDPAPVGFTSSSTCDSGGPIKALQALVNILPLAEVDAVVAAKRRQRSRSPRVV